jgi:hypothetical protein
MRTDRHRPRRWQQFIDSIDLQAVESLLGFLASASDLLSSNSETNELYFLPTRVADDVKMALEGLLSGYLQISSDAMRDAMETELYIRDFALDPRQIQRWRDADEDTLNRHFRPNNLRQRHANALGIHVTEVPGATDYQAHSKLLHVKPPLLFSRSPEVLGHQAIYVLDALHEIMFHGVSAVEALVALFDAVGQSASDSSATLSALRSAADDISTARAATVGLGIAIKEAFRSDAYGDVIIYEGGLVVAITKDCGRADFFATDRIDFRRFHREVTSEKAAPFTLESLGSSEV